MRKLGKIVYTLWYKPVEIIRATLKTGIRQTVEIAEGKRLMNQASENLKEIRYPGDDNHTVYFLSGEKYWFQTSFCLYSLQLVAGTNINAVIVDDGTINDELEKKINHQFPSTVTVIRTTQLNNYLDKTLPWSKFPVLRQRRLIYPHLRKLTDVHVIPGLGFKLVMDSDMLFFKTPSEIVSWLEKPEKLLFMQDVTESYGYSKELLQELTGVKNIPERLNVGVAGLPSAILNWPQLEHWTNELLKREGTSYLQEQALTAMIAALHPYIYLNETDYKVLPKIISEKVPEVLHHYVADAKYDYFVKGWRHLLSPDLDTRQSLTRFKN